MYCLYLFKEYCKRNLILKKIVDFYSYNGGRSADAFFGFLKEKVEADKVGRVDALDTLIKNFELAKNK